MQHLEPSGAHVCHCGRSFSQLGAFSKHQRLCVKSLKRLSSALNKAKEAWITRKRRRIVPVLPNDDHPTGNASAGPTPMAEVSELVRLFESMVHSRTEGLVFSSVHRKNVHTRSTTLACQ